VNEGISVEDRSANTAFAPTVSEHNMRRFTLIATVLISYVLHGQNDIELLTNIQLVWSEYSVGIDPLLKREIILQGNELPEIVQSGFSSKVDYLNAFHPIYINADTLIDFIYQGSSGAESDLVEIFINYNGVLKSIHAEMGRILGITRIVSDSPLQLIFEQYGCCDDPLNFRQVWTLIQDKSEIRIDKSNRIHYYEMTLFPDRIDENLMFQVTRTPYKLRATPEIVADENSFHNFDKGNIIAEFGQGDTGYALSSKTDETGRKWWFVIMDPTNQKSLYNVGGMKEEKWFGWMSSRYLDICNVR